MSTQQQPANWPTQPQPPARRESLGKTLAIIAGGLGVFAVCFFVIVPLVTAKANIANDCTMNGFGAGSCSFTNRGDASGSVCGKIKLKRDRDGKMESSSSFCSGEVAKKSTTKVEFSLPRTRDLCVDEATATGAKSWSDVCSFDFEDEASK